MSPDAILTPTQEQVLSLIAAGSTASAAAASAGIHRNTISNWLRGSPAFSQALSCVHFDRALYWREQAESLAPGAVEAIRGIMADVAAPAAIRLKAALAILDKAAALLPPPPSTPESNDAESMHNHAQVPLPAAVRSEAKPTPPEPPQPVESFAPSAPCGSGKNSSVAAFLPPSSAPVAGARYRAASVGSGLLAIAPSPARPSPGP